MDWIIERSGPFSISYISLCIKLWFLFHIELNFEWWKIIFVIFYDFEILIKISILYFIFKMYFFVYMSLNVIIIFCYIDDIHFIETPKEFLKAIKYWLARVRDERCGRLPLTCQLCISLEHDFRISSMIY